MTVAAASAFSALLAGVLVPYLPALPLRADLQTDLWMATAALLPWLVLGRDRRSLDLVLRAPFVLATGVLMLVVWPVATATLVLVWCAALLGIPAEALQPVNAALAWVELLAAGNAGGLPPPARPTPPRSASAHLLRRSSPNRTGTPMQVAPPPPPP